MFPNISIQMLSTVKVMRLIACFFHISSESFDVLQIELWTSLHFQFAAQFS